MIKKPHKVTNLDWKLLQEIYPDNLEKIVEKINENYPIQYLIGHVNFYGYKIIVNESVLIPRFETETLVEYTLSFLHKYNFENPKIIDLGTGSGCISIALKKEYPSSKITAIDNSKKALEIASKNIKLNNVDINLLQKDIFKDTFEEKYDVIISNPPYISHNLKVSLEVNYEPQNAIYADDNGLIYYKKIAVIAQKILNKKAIIALEISYNQADDIKNIFEQILKKAAIKTIKDYNNFDRYVFIFLNCE